MTYRDMLSPETRAKLEEYEAKTMDTHSFEQKIICELAAGPVAREFLLDRDWWHLEADRVLDQMVRNKTIREVGYMQFVRGEPVVDVEYALP